MKIIYSDSSNWRCFPPVGMKKKIEKEKASRTIKQYECTAGLEWDGVANEALTFIQGHDDMCPWRNIKECSLQRCV